MSDIKTSCCPRCGGEAKTEVIPVSGEIYFGVVCAHCGAKSRAKLRVDFRTNFLDVEKTMDTAIKAWNEAWSRRAGDADSN